jgi:signal transduction histidine kinase
MQLSRRLPDVFGEGRTVAERLIPWPSLWRGGLIALAVAFVLSTQFLFQVEFYRLWGFADIVRGWMDHFVDLLTVGGCIFVALIFTGSLNPRFSAIGHATVMVSIALGALAGEAWLVTSAVPLDAETMKMLLAKSARWWSIGALAYTIYVYRRRTGEAAAQAHANQLQRMQLERQIAEAQLHRLRAQIEPHFLFNTLANVQRLCEVDPAGGQRLLANFITYLRAALPEMQSDETTLQREIELARAYLDLLHVRMGERLRFRLDVPRELQALPFPTLALSTLTENAIKHGLNPLPQGGSIEIAARCDDGRLVVEVADTGAGLRHSGGSGCGLANLQARLAALYGDAASLEIGANLPRGIRATITVPVPRAGARSQR